MSDRELVAIPNGLADSLTGEIVARRTETSFQVVGEMEMTAAIGLLQGWQLAQSSLPWWIGDLLAYGEDRYGQDIYQAIVEQTGRSKKTVINYTWCCRAWPAGLRRADVTFSHHYVLNRLVREQPKIAVALLKRAVELDWSKAQLEANVNRLGTTLALPGAFADAVQHLMRQYHLTEGSARSFLRAEPSLRALFAPSPPPRVAGAAAAFEEMGDDAAVDDAGFEPLRAAEPEPEQPPRPPPPTPSARLISGIHRPACPTCECMDLEPPPLPDGAATAG